MMLLCWSLEQSIVYVAELFRVKDIRVDCKLLDGIWCFAVLQTRGGGLRTI